MYVPVVKVREAELDALQPWSARPLLPLFELVEHENRGLGSEMMFCLEQVRACWADACLVDVGQLATTPMERAFAWQLAEFWLRHQGIINVSPVVDPDDDPAVHRAAAGTAALSSSAALRVDAATADPTTLLGTLTATASRLATGIDRTHLIIDWRDAPSAPALDDLEQSTRRLLHAAGAGWASVAVVGTGAGPGATGEGVYPRDRREWWLWLRLLHAPAGLPQAVTYGDYGGFPAPKPGNGRATIPTVRYTGSMTSAIVRHRNGKNRQDPTGLHKCAVDIVRSSAFRGANFSDGDRFLADAAQDPGAKTNPTGWRRIALQHHFALVDDQLAAPPAAPPAGTP